jgi:hypothetical protein
MVTSENPINMFAAGSVSVRLRHYLAAFGLALGAAFGIRLR